MQASPHRDGNGRRPSPSPSPLHLPGGERKSERGVAGKKERWLLLTRRLHGHGTFPIRNLGIYTG